MLFSEYILSIYKFLHLWRLAFSSSGGNDGKHIKGFLKESNTIVHVVSELVCGFRTRQKVRVRHEGITQGPEPSV